LTTTALTGQFTCRQPLGLSTIHAQYNGADMLLILLSINLKRRYKCIFKMAVIITTLDQSKFEIFSTTHQHRIDVCRI